MLSPSSIRRFLESLKIENTEEENQIINSIISKLKQQTNNDVTKEKEEGILLNESTTASEDEKRRRFEDILRCKFFGSLLAKIGDKFTEKYSQN